MSLAPIWAVDVWGYAVRIDELEKVKDLPCADFERELKRAVCKREDLLQEEAPEWELCYQGAMQLYERRQRAELAGLAPILGLETLCSHWGKQLGGLEVPELVPFPLSIFGLEPLCLWGQQFPFHAACAAGCVRRSALPEAIRHAEWCCNHLLEGPELEVFVHRLVRSATGACRRQMLAYGQEALLEGMALHFTMFSNIVHVLDFLRKARRLRADLVALTY